VAHGTPVVWPTPQPLYCAPPVVTAQKGPWVVGALVALPVPAVGMVVAIAVGKAASGLSVPATSEPLLPEPTAKDYSIALTVGSKQRFGSAGRNAIETAYSEGVQASGSGRALLGWTRFGSPGIFG
jgi:hypothetical protein